MKKRPTYEELERRVRELEKKSLRKKRIEKQLTYRTLLFDALIQTSIDGILVVDEQGGIVLSNDRMREIWEVPLEIWETRDDDELLQFVMEKLRCPEEFKKKVDWLYANKKENSWDEIGLSDGRWIERFSSPLIDKFDTYHGRIWFFRDISHRKKTEHLLKKLNEELEARVVMRSSELFKSHQQLTEQMAELKKTKQALEQSEEDMREMLNATKDSALLLGPDGNILGLNDIVAKRFGKEKESLLGVNCCDILPSDIAKTRKKWVKEVLQTGKTVTFQDERAGIFFNHSIYPLLDSEGKVARLVVFSHDITKEKRIEESLLQSEKRLKSILTNLPGAVFISDLKGRLRHVNKAACQSTGYSESELLQLSVADIDKESVARSDSTTLWNSLDSVKPITIESFHMKKDKSEFPVEIHLQAIFLGQERMILGNVFDISVRKEVERTMEYNRKLLRTILNNIDAFIYISDMKTHEVLFANDKLVKWFKEDPTGERCWQFFHGDKTGPCDDCTNAQLIDASGNPVNRMVWEQFYPEFNRWYERSNLALSWVNGGIVRLDIWLDITERKEIERKQKRIKEILKTKVEKRTLEMKELNTALRVLLKQKEGDEKKLLKRMVARYENMIQPFVQQLKSSLSDNVQIQLMHVLESNLRELVQPFSKKSIDPLSMLTSAEIQVAIMVRQGLSSKEIAEILNVSVRTVTNHRDHMRKKMGLANKKVNLYSFLNALQDNTYK